MKKLLPIVLLFFSCQDYSPRLLSEQEYQQFGEHIVKSIEQGNLKALDNMVNLSTTYDKLEHTIDSLKLTKLVQNAKWKSYRIELSANFSLYWKKLQGIAKYNGKVEVSRYYEEHGVPHLIIATSSPDMIDICDFELTTIGDQTFITDYTSYGTGIVFSELFIEDALLRLTNRKEYRNALEELKNTNNYMARNTPEKAWNAISRVPEYISYQANFQSIKTQTALAISDSLYADCLLNWISYHGHKQGFRYLKSIELYHFIGDDRSASLYLDSLEAQAGNSLAIQIWREQLIR